MHRCPFAVGACFAVSFFIHPGIFQVIGQPGRGKVIVAIQAQGSILFVTVGEGNARAQLERGTFPDVQKLFIHKRAA